MITQRTEREADMRHHMSSIEKELGKKEKCATLLTKLLVLENLLIFHQNTCLSLTWNGFLTEILSR